MSDQEYYKRFNAYYEVMRTAGGHVGQHPALIKVYKNDGQSDNDVTNSVEEAMAVVMFLKGADPIRHGELLRDLHNQHTRGLGEYPKDPFLAYKLMTVYDNVLKKGRLVLQWRIKESLSPQKKKR